MRAKILGKMLILLLIMFPIVAFSHTKKEEPDVFVMAMIRPDTQLFGKWQKMVYTDLFKRLGMEVEYRYFPSRRATEVASKGMVDGEPARPSDYQKKYDTLIRIEEPVFQVNYSAFSRKELPATIDSWQSLADPKLLGHYVEYRLGIHICASTLPLYVENEFLSAINTTNQGLLKLKAGYSDIFVDEETGVLTLLNNPEFNGCGIKRVGILKAFPAYMYLAKKNAYLVKQITQTIKEMKQEGVIEAYRVQLNKEFNVINPSQGVNNTGDCDDSKIDVKP